MTLRLTASDPLFAEWDFLLTVRAAWINAACHYDLSRVPEIEQVTAIGMLTTDVVHAFEELVR